MAEQFQILSPRTHIRTRTQMYLGSTSVEETEQFLFGKWTKVCYTPALFKMINEILDNSIDEYIRSNAKFANKIDVSFDGNSVTVTDNGRGIPQDVVITPEGEKIPFFSKEEKFPLDIRRNGRLLGFMIHICPGLSGVAILPKVIIQK